MKSGGCRRGSSIVVELSVKLLELGWSDSDVKLVSVLPGERYALGEVLLIALVWWLLSAGITATFALASGSMARHTFAGARTGAAGGAEGGT